MFAAEFVVLLLVGGLLYIVLTPVRRAIEKRFIRRRLGKRTATVIPLVRRSDGVFAPRPRKENDHGHKR
ncbi:MAG TPA: hypothetical protein VEI94_05120 [Candidatus Bathyarchaeia archaeon]|nr:hypothetical protein [Candidatus Bathyarchaeia archaeon]